MVKGLGRMQQASIGRRIPGPMRDMTRCPYCRMTTKKTMHERDECRSFQCGGYVVDLQGVGLTWTHEDVVPYAEAFDVRRPGEVLKEFYTEDV